MPTRRHVIRLGAGAVFAGGVSLSSTRSASGQTTVTWSVGDLSAETSDGLITDVVLNGDTSTLELSWVGLESTSDPIDLAVDVRATSASTNDHLSSGATQYETLVSDSVSPSSTSGSVEQTFTNTFTSATFPVSIPQNHSSLSVSDFEADSSTKQKVELEMRVSAVTPSTTGAAEDSFQVTVSEASGGTIAGTVEFDLAGADGAEVFVIDTSNDTLAATTTTDSSGNFSVSVSTGEYHVVARYTDSNGVTYSDESRPFISV